MIGVRRRFAAIAALAATLAGSGGGGAGCGSYDSQDEYAEARAEAECSKLEKCSLGMFEATYRSEDDCIGERTDAIDDYNDARDDNECVYQPDEAGHCVSRLRGLSCEEWERGNGERACDLVWDCEGLYGTFTTPTYATEVR